MRGREGERKRRNEGGSEGKGEREREGGKRVRERGGGEGGRERDKWIESHLHYYQPELTFLSLV